MKHISLIQYQEEICTDETHRHNDELQKMASVLVAGVRFDITKDGDEFYVRTPGFKILWGVNFERMIRFMKWVVYRTVQQ